MGPCKSGIETQLSKGYEFSFVVDTVLISRRLRWAGHVARMEEGRRALKILTGTPAGNRPLERPRRKWDQ